MQERLQATIPNSNKWHNEDVEARAKQLGMEKSEFILNAVDMMMNFDETFFKKIQGYSEGLHIPEWLVMQNMIIKEMAKEAAEVATNTWRSKVLSEFMFVGEGFDKRTLTGEELFNQLKNQHVSDIQRRIRVKKELKEIQIHGKSVDADEIESMEFDD